MEKIVERETESKEQWLLEEIEQRSTDHGVVLISLAERDFVCALARAELARQGKIVLTSCV